MTTALARDQFDIIMGARRGGGASHRVLPHPNSPANFQAGLAGMRADPEFAASAAGASYLLELQWYIGSRFDSSEPGRIAQDILRALLVNTPPMEYTNVEADGYLTSVIDRDRELAEDAHADAQQMVLTGVADRIAMRIWEMPVVGQASQLKSLLAPRDLTALEEASGDNRWRELHGRGPVLADQAYWRTAIARALTLGGLEAALDSIHAAAATAVDRAVEAAAT